jgi:enamine deaminase RidA (YjgF/YER057c/UK114 family)
MSQAVVHRGVVTTAGQVALGAPGEDATAQTQDVLNSIDELLAAAGTDKTKLLTANIWLADMKDFKAMNGVWDAWLAADCAPTRACVESKLASPQFVVEIAVTAAVD